MSIFYFTVTPSFHITFSTLYYHYHQCIITINLYMYYYVYCYEGEHKSAACNP